MRWLTALLFGLIVLPCSASVTRGNPFQGQFTSDFPGVGLFGHIGLGSSPACSAVAIGDGSHVLTTRHCVTLSGGISGATRPAGDFWFQAGGGVFRGVEVFADFDADLALVQLDSVVPDAYDLWTPDLPTELGQTFRGVGLGANDPNGNGVWGPGGEGVKREFANTFDAISPGSIAGQGEVLRYDFDLLSAGHIGDLEGLHGPGDSGGGAFLADPSGGESWLLAGVMSSSTQPVEGGTGSLVRVAAYHGQIIALIPEPTTALLLSVPVLVLARRRA